MNKEEIIKQFISENHWLICDCDLPGEHQGECSMNLLIPGINKMLSQYKKI